MPAHLPGGRPAGTVTFDPQIAIAFGRAVVAERIAIGKSQLTLALDASIERTHMGRIERGQNVPNLVAVMKIAHALGCSAAHLVEQTERELARRSTASGSKAKRRTKKSERTGS